MEIKHIIITGHSSSVLIGDRIMFTGVFDN